MTTDKKISSIDKIAAGIADKALRSALRTFAQNARATGSSQSDAASPVQAASVHMRYAYIFFNCDAGKEPSSMNIRFNAEAYGDSAQGREALCRKIQLELSAGNISVSDMDAVKEAILQGEPGAANAMLGFGCIEKLDLM